VLIRVDDTKAKYPLVIDPFIEVAELTSSEGIPNDYFGNSVAISGNTLVIGAPQFGNPGAAYVFVEPATGWATTSTFVARLTPSDGVRDSFGSSVAISGNTIIVGAPNFAVGPNLQQGATYLFVEPVTGWATMTETAKLTASDGKASDAFGESVSISGSKLVVGAPGASDEFAGSQTPGAAYLFVRPSSGWATTSTFKAKLTASDSAVKDLFGWGVAINQDQAPVL
jgi:FG-GAP repeat